MQWERLEWEGWTAETTEAPDADALNETAEGVEERGGVTAWELNTEVGVWLVEVDGEWAVVRGNSGTRELLDAINALR